MKQRLIPRLFLTLFIVLSGIALSTIYTDYSIKGALIKRLPARCELWMLEKPIQPEQTIALACPGIDLFRLWPLPDVQPWDEDICSKLELSKIYLVDFAHYDVRLSYR